MTEFFFEKNLEKSERVSVRRRYTMKTLNGHIKEPESSKKELLRLVPVFMRVKKLCPDARILVLRQFLT
jgi:hypothetical protein